MPRVVHFEIPATDPERAVAFYKGVFGWEINKWEGSEDYWLIKTGPPGELGIDGAIMRRQGEATGDSPTAYLCTVGVESIDEYLEKVKQAGGLVLTPKMPIPGVGTFAYCRDTEGNQFGIIQPEEGAM